MRQGCDFADTYWRRHNGATFDQKTKKQLMVVIVLCNSLTSSQTVCNSLTNWQIKKQLQVLYNWTGIIITVYLFIITHERLYIIWTLKNLTSIVLRKLRSADSCIIQRLYINITLSWQIEIQYKVNENRGAMVTTRLIVFLLLGVIVGDRVQAWMFTPRYDNLFIYFPLLQQL